MAITKYDLDINKQAIIKPVVILRQGDHDIDTMQVSLSVANEPMDLTGATVTFMGNTANGRQIIDDAHVKIIDAKGGVFEYVFPSQASSDIGEYKVAYFSIILANGQSSTMDFRVQVLSGVDISAPVASEYITHYDTMVTALNSAYDSATRETNKKMASTVSSLATSAATVLDSALARVNTINSTANNASSTASKAVSMASSVASTITSQASYINSVASSAASNVSSVAASVVDKLNNLSIGGRNYLLNSSGDTLSGWSNADNMWSITSDQTRGNVFTGTPTITWTGGGKNSIYQTINKKIAGQHVTISFWAKSSVNGAKFHSEPQGGGNAFNTTLTTDWTRYSYTVSNFTDKIYLMAVDAGTTYYLDDIKLEVGNMPTDWTPAPEDLMNKSNELPAEARDFNYLATHMQTYQGTWYNRSESVANAPTGNWTYSVIEVIAGNSETTGVIRTTRFATNAIYSATINGGTVQRWALIADDTTVVHKIGNETVAGDKMFTGNTTLANIKSSNVKTGSVKLGGLTINFRETAVGVNVYMDGSWQGSFSMGDAYVDSGSIPTSISNPRQNVVLNIIGNAGVGGVTTNSPFKLEVLITTDGKVKYRSKNLRDNDTAARTATIVGAASTFYALD